MQHIVVMTSNTKPLLNESGWTTNGVNRKGSMNDINCIEICDYYTLPAYIGIGRSPRYGRNKFFSNCLSTELEKKYWE